MNGANSEMTGDTHFIVFYLFLNIFILFLTNINYYINSVIICITLK